MDLNYKFTNMDDESQPYTVLLYKLRYMVYKNSEKEQFSLHS